MRSPFSPARARKAWRSLETLRDEMPVVRVLTWSRTKPGCSAGKLPDPAAKAGKGLGRPAAAAAAIAACWFTAIWFSCAKSAADTSGWIASRSKSTFWVIGDGASSFSTRLLM